MKKSYRRKVVYLATELLSSLCEGAIAKNEVTLKLSGFIQVRLV